MSDTPETDAAWKEFIVEGSAISTLRPVSEKLERERDELRAEVERLKADKARRQNERKAMTPDYATEHVHGEGAFRMPAKLVTSGRGFVGCMAFLGAGVDPTGERELWDVEIIVVPHRKCRRIKGGVGDWRIDQIYTSGFLAKDWMAPYWESASVANTAMKGEK